MRTWPNENRLIGRGAEIRRLGSFASALGAGAYAAVIEAPEGMGKTVLWEEGIRVSTARGVRVLTTRPSRAELGFAFAALGDLLEGVTGDLVTDLPAPQRRALECVLLRAEPATGSLDMRAISLGVLQVVRTLSRAQPVLLAIDDLQWLDSGSAHVLGFVLRRLPAEPVGLLATLRSGRPEPTLQAVLDHSSVTPLPLDPLSARQLEKLVWRRLGTALPRPVLARVHRAAGGNPRWGLEIAAELRRHQGQRLSSDLVPVPDGLVDRVSARLSELSPAARVALMVASALRRPTPGLVRAALTRTEAGPEGLHQAVEAGALDVRGEEVVCREPILATVAYAGATPAQRQAVHLALAASVPDRPEHTWHEALGLPGANAELAGRLEEMARQAWSGRRPETAARLAEAALEHTPGDDAGAVLRRCLQAADGWAAAGDPGRARGLLLSLLDRLDQGRGRAEVLYRLGRLAVQDRGLPAGRTLLRQALRESAEDPALEARVELELAWTAQAAAEAPEAGARASRALALATRAGAWPVRLEAAAVLAWVDGGCDGEPATRLQDAWPSLREEAARGTVSERPALVLADLLLRAGDVGAARTTLDDLARHCHEQGQEATRAILLHRIAEVECWVGNARSALHRAREGLRAARASGQRMAQARLLAAAALADVHAGRPRAARTAAGKSVELAASTGDVGTELLGREVLGLLELACADPAAAEEHFRAVRKHWRQAHVWDPWSLRFVPDHVEALVLLGRLDSAASLLTWWEQAAGPHPPSWVRPLVERAGADLMVARGDLEPALARLREVAETAGQLPPLERGRTLLKLGTLERRLKQRAAARASLGRALETFRPLRAERWAGEAARELRRVGEPPQAEALTATEARVAELVAQGLTNLEVAQRLFLSPRTVESNLTSVYRKLEVRGRARLASRLGGGGQQRA